QLLRLGDEESEAARRERQRPGPAAVDAVLHPQVEVRDVRRAVAVVVEAERAVPVRIDEETVPPHGRRSVLVVGDDVELQVERLTRDDRTQIEGRDHLIGQVERLSASNIQMPFVRRDRKSTRLNSSHDQISYA